MSEFVSRPSGALGKKFRFSCCPLALATEGLINNANPFGSVRQNNFSGLPGCCKNLGGFCGPSMVLTPTQNDQISPEIGARTKPVQVVQLCGDYEGF